MLIRRLPVVPRIYYIDVSLKFERNLYFCQVYEIEKIEKVVAI